MKALFLYLLGAVIVFAMVIYLGIAQPQALTRLIVKIDRFGWTQEGASEQRRFNQIMAMPIAYEKKQALVDHTVFMGATQDMVLLSLGRPREKFASEDGMETWQYFFSEDTKPTFLVFKDGQLYKAYRASALELKR